MPSSLTIAGGEGGGALTGSSFSSLSLKLFFLLLSAGLMAGGQFLLEESVTRGGRSTSIPLQEGRDSVAFSSRFAAGGGISPRSFSSVRRISSFLRELTSFLNFSTSSSFSLS